MTFREMERPDGSPAVLTMPPLLAADGCWTKPEGGRVPRLRANCCLIQALNSSPLAARGAAALSDWAREVAMPGIS